MKQFWRLTALQLKLTFGIATLKAQLKGSAKEKRKAVAKTAKKISSHLGSNWDGLKAYHSLYSLSWVSDSSPSRPAYHCPPTRISK